MKEFRIARCISEDGKSVKKYAIFKDGSIRKEIEIDQFGKEYFEISDWIQGTPEMDEFNYGDFKESFKNSFKWKPEDAVESIRRGYGDVIARKFLFFGKKLDVVLYFLDREYGEKLRKESIEGWKDTSFGYVLYFNDTPLNRNGEKDYEKEDVFFDDIKDVIKLAENMVNNALTIASNLIDLPYTDRMGFMILMNNKNYQPAVELVVSQFENIYDAGELKLKDGVSFEALLRNFKIHQEPILREEE